MPPAGFVLSGRFQGFMREDTLSSIMLNEMPAEAFLEFKTVAPAAFAAQGMRHLGTCRIPGLAVPQVCHRLTQDTAIGPFRKWFLVLGHAAFTAQVVVNVPDEAIQSGEMAEADIEAALTTIAFVVSENLAQASKRKFRSLGSFQLKGLSEEQPAFTPSEATRPVPPRRSSPPA